MNVNNTVKNWKWWLVLPLSITLIILLLIPKVIIWILYKLISVVELVNFGDRPVKRISQLTNWVLK